MTTKKQDAFEYNDGLGDLLREKRRSEFSWFRSGAGLMVVVLGVFIGLTVLLKVVKPLFFSSEKIASAPVSVPKPVLRRKPPVVVAVKPVVVPVEKKPMPVVVVEKKVVPVVAAVPVHDKDGVYRVCAGTFSSKENAESVRSKLASNHFQSVVMPIERTGKVLYRIELGSFKTSAEAHDMVKKLKQIGVDSYPVFVQ